LKDSYIKKTPEIRLIATIPAKKLIITRSDAILEKYIYIMPACIIRNKEGKKPKTESTPSDIHDIPIFRKERHTNAITNQSQIAKRLFLLRQILLLGLLNSDTPIIKSKSNREDAPAKLDP